MDRKDPKGFTALMQAAMQGNETSALLLVNRGADIATTNHRGTTPLMCAARGGCTILARLLLEKGVDFERTNGAGESALSLARQSGHRPVKRLLKEAIKRKQPPRWYDFGRRMRESGNK